MILEFRRFRQEYYPEYASWFDDPELNNWLGPMDLDWLAAVLAEPESEGATWAVFRGKEFVAVIEAVFDAQNPSLAYFAAIATKPSLRRQGIGTAVLQQLLGRHREQGITEHIALVALTNEAARRCVERIGFAQATDRPDEHGYVRFRHCW
jgi:ribosomal protein S18 acetylase RimI-like enzyme